MPSQAPPRDWQRPGPSGEVKFLRGLGLLLPATHMIAIMRGVVLRGAGPVELLPNVLALVAISAVLVASSARGVRKVAS